MKLCFIPDDFDGPGCYRAIFPCMALREQLGHEAFLPPYDELHRRDGGLLVNWRYGDIPACDVYVKHFPKGTIWPGLLRGMRAQGAAVVVDVDDYYLGVPAYNIGSRGDYRETFRAISSADLVTVTTPFLADAYSRFNPNVKVLRNRLEWGMWDDAPQQSEVERRRIRVGWMGQRRWAAGNLNVLKGVIGPFLDRHPEVEFVAAGDDRVHADLGVPEGQRVTTGQVSFRHFDLADITAVMDIGLVPLERNSFNEGKSHLKGMEYAACGIPCVATPTESYEWWVDDGENGFLARRAKDWIRWLELLVSDDGLRREMGRAARRRAAASTIQRHVGEWEATYTGLLGGLPAETLAAACVTRKALQKPAELAPLLDRVRKLRPRVVVEIGTASGGSWFGWCRLADPEATLVSIDLPDGPFGGVARDEATLRSYGQPGQILHFIDGDSHDRRVQERLEEILAGRPVDFLMVDGDHSYAGVRSDWETYGPLVRAGGLVAFHDVLPHPQVPECQVDRLWQELRGMDGAAEFLDPADDRGWGQWGGIGVLQIAERKAGHERVDDRDPDAQGGLRERASDHVSVTA